METRNFESQRVTYTIDCNNKLNNEVRRRKEVEERVCSNRNKDYKNYSFINRNNNHMRNTYIPQFILCAINVTNNKFISANIKNLSQTLRITFSL